VTDGLILRIALCEIDKGRFEDIIHALRIKDVCAICSYFNRSLTPSPENQYRCHCLGTCIDATLHPQAVSYLNWKLGWIDEATHRKNCGL